MVCLSRLGDDGYRIYLEIFGGGYGASARADGCDAVDSEKDDVPVMLTGGGAGYGDPLERATTSSRATSIRG